MVNSRAKGIRGELRVAELYQAIYPQARRNYQSVGREVDGPDIAGCPPWLSIESKQYKNVRWGDLMGWLGEYTGLSRGHGPGMGSSIITPLHVSKTRRGSLVCLTEEDWLKVVKWLRDSGYPGETKP